MGRLAKRYRQIVRILVLFMVGTRQAYPTFASRRAMFTHHLFANRKSRDRDHSKGGSADEPIFGSSCPDIMR
jgi:hypothetical protein